MKSISPFPLRRADLRARRAGIVFAVCAALTASDIASAQRATRGAAVREHWVASWATAQLLVPMNLGRPVGAPPAAPAGAPGAVTAPPAAPAAPRPTPPPPIVPAPPIPASFADQTIRMVVR